MLSSEPHRVTIMRRSQSSRALNGDRTIIAALGVTVLLVGTLTIHTALAERTQRDTADRALRQLAAGAAWQYAQRVTADIEHSARMTLLPVVDRSFGGGRSATPSALALLDRRVVRGPICPVPIQPIGFARLDLRSNKLDLSGRGWQPGDTDRVRPLLAGLLAPGGEAIRHHGEPALLVLEGNGRTGADILLVAIARTEQQQPVAVYTALARPAALAALLADAVRTSELLPPAIAHGLPNDSLLSLRISSGGGVPILQPGRTGTHAAATSLEAQAGQLRVDVALLPAAVAGVDLPQLLALGSPTLASVFMLAVALMGLAIVQSRRRAELARARADFVAGVSHELHAPLALIRSHAETLMLEREESREERRHFLEIVLRESARLTRLVDGILGFSEPNRASMRVEIECLAIVPILESVAADFRLATAARGCTIEVAGSHDVWARGDAEAIRQVLINLVDNALKHGPAHQCIRIAVASDGATVAITVDDQGRAIPPSERERVFERYVRLPSHDGRRRHGSGIGLSVVRDLCRMQGGDATLETAPGGGTRVRLTLPCGAPLWPAEASPIVTASATIRPSDGLAHDQSNGVVR